jgi:glycerophosphoryl diester phosphodiesterase
LTAIYGHRGARGERPENTIEGFLHARSLGLAGIECDIVMTRDFVAVVHHDPDLPPEHLIRDLSFAQLHQLAPQVPKLAQALQAAPDMEWLIEIKTFPDGPRKSHPPEAMAEAVLAVLEAAGKLHQAYILAFDWRVLSAVGRMAPAVRRVCLTAPETEQSREIWWGTEFRQPTPDAVAQTNAFGWAPFHRNLTIDQIDHAHRLGLKVFPWTVNAKAEFARLATVDGIITDYPSAAAGIGPWPASTG